MAMRVVLMAMRVMAGEIVAVTVPIMIVMAVIRVPLDPIMMMTRLDLRTALKLNGAYHVTSPTYLESILKNGLMPGGGQGKRIMNFFIVFPPWDERNRVTRTRSPLFEEL